jgi:hypothetical protein
MWFALKQAERWVNTVTTKLQHSGRAKKQARKVKADSSSCADGIEDHIPGLLSEVKTTQALDELMEAREALVHASEAQKLTAIQLRLLDAGLN